jgi:hypothetical protein
MIPLTKRRHPRTPSRRNQEIYAAVKIRGCRQIDVAKDSGLTQGRVSEIIAQVEKWRAHAAAADQGTLTQQEQRRADRWLVRQCLEELFQMTMRAMAGRRSPSAGPTDDSPSAREATPSNPQSAIRNPQSAASNPQSEIRNPQSPDSLRQQALDLQRTKTALRITEDILKFSELDPLPEPQPEEDEDKELKAIADRLWRYRRAAEEAGKVAKSEDAGLLTHQWLAVLLGHDVGSLTPGFVPPGPAVKEMVRRFLSQPIPIQDLPKDADEFLEEVGCDKRSAGTPTEPAATPRSEFRAPHSPAPTPHSEFRTPHSPEPCNIPDIKNPPPIRNPKSEIRNAPPPTPIPPIPCSSPPAAYISPNVIPLPQEKNQNRNIPRPQSAIRNLQSAMTRPLSLSPPLITPPLITHIIYDSPRPLEAPPAPWEAEDLKQRINAHLQALVPKITTR